MNIKKLKEPFPIERISWRVGATNKEKTSGIALAYIDARDVMERLDEVCGPENWQVKYSHANSKTIAEIGIKIDGEWIWKANGAGDTQVEAEKGAISDAMKRAAVCWGIGRYLYDVPNVWVDLEPQGRSYKIKNPNDPRLEGGLNKAEALARGEKVHIAPKPKSFFKDAEHKKQWMLDAKDTIEAFEQSDQVTVWIHENLTKINELGPNQQKSINDLCAEHKERIDQKQFEEKVAAE